MHAHTATMLSSKNTNLSTPPLIWWLPIVLWIKPRFLKQSELCPHFLSHVTYFPYVNTMLSLRIEMLWLCAFDCLFPPPAMPFPMPIFTLCTYPVQCCRPENSSFKFHSILSLLNGFPWLSLHYLSLRSCAPHFNNNSQKAWTLKLSLPWGNKRGMLLFSC